MVQHALHKPHLPQRHHLKCSGTEELLCTSERSRPNCVKEVQVRSESTTLQKSCSGRTVIPVPCFQSQLCTSFHYRYFRRLLICTRSVWNYRGNDINPRSFRKNEAPSSSYACRSISESPGASVTERRALGRRTRTFETRALCLSEQRCRQNGALPRQRRAVPRNTLQQLC